MKIEGATALITGANRGLGAAFARTLLERGARTVYAGARNPGNVSDPGVVPVELDITAGAPSTHHLSSRSSALAPASSRVSSSNGPSR